jgi:hypothetical protein
MEEVGKPAQDLARMAVALREAVGRFELGHPVVSGGNGKYHGNWSNGARVRVSGR